MGKNKTPDATQMSAEERSLYQKQTELLDQINKVYGQSVSNANEQQDLFKRVSGLYDVGPDGKMQLNQNAIKRQTDLVNIQLDRYEKALKGLLPVSEGTTQRKANDFASLKENAARRGIVISGDAPENAVSNSTSGNELIGQFKRTYGLIEDAERRGELAGAVNPTYTTVGLANSSGPDRLLSSGMGLSNAYGSAAAPYANQRMMEYQSALAKSAYDQQRRGGILGAGFSGAAIGGQVGGITGAIVGGGAGLLGGIGV